MPVINILSPHVADLIAAGEVVERPGSVIKELMENAVDAGAKNITVEIRGGGMTYLRVTDDGCGMAPEDAGIAFLRHATSKLRDAQGLEAIGTLGFRGEALAAISAVSRIELTTRTRDADSGTRVTLEAGDIQTMEPVGCPMGTTMVVRDLFYNTPARQKFMKTDRAEAANCLAAARRSALGHPEVSVRFLRDGKEEFFSPGDGQIRSAIYSLLGREAAGDMIACSLRDEAVSVEGFVSLPHAGRGNRGGQFFYCNGRPIRSVTMQTALERAYANRIMGGRYPACVLYLTVSKGAVDVNVHPTKSEVRFTQEKPVFDGVYYAVLSALDTGGETAEIALSPSTRKAVEAPAAPAPTAKAAPREDFYQSMRSEDFRASLSAKSDSPFGKIGQGKQHMTPLRAAMTGTDFSTARKNNDSTAPLRTPAVPYTPARETAPAPEQTALPMAETPAVPVRVIGEAMAGYILAESGDTLYIIDKHAAHERINFDRLRAQAGPVMAQHLLVPVVHSGSADTLLANARLLEQFGFTLEAYGEDAVAVRTVPAALDLADIPATLEELTEALEKGGLDPAGARDTVLRTIACKAAIKAGRSSQPAELEALARRVVSGEVQYCPHGRPVALKLTKKDLDRQFKRIV